MATFESVGGLTADLLHDIDDPFSSAAPFRDRTDTLPDPPLFPEGNAESAGDCVDLPFQVDGVPAPVLSRPSGLIMLPVPIFASAEEGASLRGESVARARTGWSERVMVLGFTAIIVAASWTALREHAHDPRLAVWRTRVEAVWMTPVETVRSALAPSEAALAADPSQRASVGARLKARPAKSASSMRTGSPHIGQHASAERTEQSAPVVEVAPEASKVAQDTSAAPIVQDHAVQAASPQELPEIVFSPRSRARHAGREHAQTRTPTPRKERARATPHASAARGAQASGARAQARMHYAARHYAQAIAAYEEAAKLDPSHALTFAGLGAARLQLGDARGAIRAYERAVQLSPTSVVLHTGLTYAYLREGNVGRARASCARALMLDSNHAAAKAACASL